MKQFSSFKRKSVSSEKTSDSAFPSDAIIDFSERACPNKAPARNEKQAKKTQISRSSSSRPLPYSVEDLYLINPYGDTSVFVSECLPDATIPQYALLRGKTNEIPTIGLPPHLYVVCTVSGSYKLKSDILGCVDLRDSFLLFDKSIDEMANVIRLKSPDPAPISGSFVYIKDLHTFFENIDAKSNLIEKQAEINRKIVLNPSELSLWKELVKFQDYFYNYIHKGSLDKKNEKIHSIWSSALELVKKTTNSEEKLAAILKEFMNSYKRQYSYSECEVMWKTLANSYNLLSVWKLYFEFISQHAASSTDFEALVAQIASFLYSFEFKSDSQRVAIVSLIVKLFVNAGFIERSLVYVLILIDFNSVSRTVHISEYEKTFNQFDFFPLKTQFKQKLYKIVSQKQFSVALELESAFDIFSEIDPSFDTKSCFVLDEDILAEVLFEDIQKLLFRFVSDDYTYCFDLLLQLIMEILNVGICTVDSSIWSLKKKNNWSFDYSTGTDFFSFFKSNIPFVKKSPCNICFSSNVSLECCLIRSLFHCKTFWQASKLSDSKKMFIEKSLHFIRTRHKSYLSKVLELSFYAATNSFDVVNYRFKSELKDSQNDLHLWFMYILFLVESNYSVSETERIFKVLLENCMQRVKSDDWNILSMILKSYLKFGINHDLPTVFEFFHSKRSLFSESFFQIFFYWSIHDEVRFEEIIKLILEKSQHSQCEIEDCFELVSLLNSKKCKFLEENFFFDHFFVNTLIKEPYCFSIELWLLFLCPFFNHNSAYKSLILLPQVERVFCRLKRQSFLRRQTSNYISFVYMLQILLTLSANPTSNIYSNKILSLFQELLSHCEDDMLAWKCFLSYALFLGTKYPEKSACFDLLLKAAYRVMKLFPLNRELNLLALNLISLIDRIKLSNSWETLYASFMQNSGLRLKCYYEAQLRD